MIGIIAGIIDILPMLKIKLDKHAIWSAFIFYLITPFFIFNLKPLGELWWLSGAFISLILALPIIIIVAKTEKKSISPMAITAVILGTLIGIAGLLLGLQ